MAGLVLALIAGMVLAFLFIPNAVVSPGDLKTVVPAAPGLKQATAPTAVDLVQARNAVRAAAVALIAGIGAAIAAGFAARTYYLSRRGQLSDRIRQAGDRLSSDVLSAVAAIGELSRLARESPIHQPQIMGILTAFLREHSRDPATEDAYPPPPAPPAVQAAFSVLAGRRTRYDGKWVADLEGADLRGVDFEGRRFMRAKLRSANLRRAKLDGAFLQWGDLRKAHLEGAEARSVRLEHAKLGGAFLGAKFEGATLDDANARKAHFEGVELQNTFMRGTNLRRSSGLAIGDDGKITGAILDPKKTKLPKS